MTKTTCEGTPGYMAMYHRGEQDERSLTARWLRYMAEKETRKGKSDVELIMDSALLGAAKDIERGVHKAWAFGNGNRGSKEGR